MVAVGVVMGEDDPRWLAMSASEAAKLLSESGLDVAQIEDEETKRANMMIVNESYI